MDTLEKFTRIDRLQPVDPGARLLLFGLRRMGRHGIDDASAAHAFMTGFGVQFRRPLVLLRAFVSETAAAASSPIQIAPWCCPRVTPAEDALLGALGHCLTDPQRADLLLGDLLGIRATGRILSVAQVLAVAFADLGLPLGMEKITPAA